MYIKTHVKQVFHMRNTHVSYHTCDNTGVPGCEAHVKRFCQKINVSRMRMCVAFLPVYTNTFTPLKVVPFR